jgi:hypothetical protein
MTRPSLKRLLLLACLSDRNSKAEPIGWRVQCLHCRRSMQLRQDGTPVGVVTLEHIVPRSWFGLAAARSLCERVADADDPRNLALACAGCNHGKGRSHDARGPADARALQVVSDLLERRLARWREPAES